jgi:hypothetical protein
VGGWSEARSVAILRPQALSWRELDASVDEPSTSIVRRGSSSRANASVTRSRFKATSGANVSWVNCRNQSATVRRVGNRAKPQKRVTSGSPPR